MEGVGGSWMGFDIFAPIKEPTSQGENRNV